MILNFTYFAHGYVVRSFDYNSFEQSHPRYCNDCLLLSYLSMLYYISSSLIYLNFLGGFWIYYEVCSFDAFKSLNGLFFLCNVTYWSKAKHYHCRTSLHVDSRLK